MIDILSAVGRECAILGMPFIAEAEFPTTYATVEELKQQYGFEYLRRNVRLCTELGADIVKTNWPGDQESFAKCVEAANGVPVVLAGGSRLERRRAALPHGTGDGRRSDRLLGGPEHLHARRTRRRSRGRCRESSGSGGPPTRRSTLSSRETA